MVFLKYDVQEFFYIFLLKSLFLEIAKKNTLATNKGYELNEIIQKIRI